MTDDIPAPADLTARIEAGKAEYTVCLECGDDLNDAGECPFCARYAAVVER